MDIVIVKSTAAVRALSPNSVKDLNGAAVLVAVRALLAHRKVAHIDTSLLLPALTTLLATVSVPSHSCNSNTLLHLHRLLLSLYSALHPPCTLFIQYLSSTCKVSLQDMSRLHHVFASTFKNSSMETHKHHWIIQRMDRKYGIFVDLNSPETLIDGDIIRICPQG
jgi:hypothetical protein